LYSQANVLKIVCQRRRTDGVTGSCQLRHTDARTTLNYIHLQGGITEQAIADLSGSLKLDADKGREASIFNSL
jgi:hypothetical protein